MEPTAGQAESQEVPGEVVLQPYSVFCSDARRPQPEQAEWVVKGTDGKFYLVPSEPGGWMLRVEYQGDIAKLTSLSQCDARSVTWIVYGDVGRATIEGADLEPR